MSRPSILSPTIFSAPKISRSSRTKKQENEADFPIVAHCHLLWDGVWQRPQQFLSRLARRNPVLFVETYVIDGLSGEALYEHGPAANAPGVTQLKIIFPRNKWGDGTYVDRERRRLVKAALLEPALRKFRRPVQWFYDPMAVVAFAGSLNERLTVYDCMDQLSQFRGAPAELLQREQQLLKIADVVFCGGKKLHDDKSQYHDNCHFYGCGVEVKHFSRARQRSTPIPEDIVNLPRPIFGYYGVVDERLDYQLLLKLAQSTSGSVVVLGPLAKVAESDLPRHPKLHWLGKRPYESLPNYAKGFDVCLMPFAMNEATEFINPTKALEYLGAGRPVVSTLVPDVVSLFPDVVRLARTETAFLQACEEEAETPNATRQTAGLRRAQANTWERIVAELEGHVVASLRAVPTGQPVFTSALQRAALL